MIFICTTKPTEIPYTVSPPYSIITDKSLVPEEQHNIFDKVSYRHIRHILYIWKHLDLFGNPDVITIFQHRRYLADPDIPQGKTAVFPRPCATTGTNSITGQWLSCCVDGVHTPEVLNNTCKVLGPEFSEYCEINPCPTAYYHNIFSLTKDLFDDYCLYLSTSLLKLEGIIGDPYLSCPVFAYVAERIGNYWAYKYCDKDKIHLSDLITI